ncbi:MAG: RDD family protein [Marinicella sp.]
MKKSKLWKHVAALIYDIFPILGLFLVTSLILVLLRQGEEVEPRTLWFQLTLFIEVFFYFTYSWKQGGQTLGMRAWKIGIQDHHTLSWLEASMRFFTGVLSVFLLGLGLWVRKFNSQQMTWMDIICHRPVIDLKPDANN